MKLHKIAAALAFTALAAASQAAPLITSFGTNTVGGFIGGSATCDGGGSCSLVYSGAVQTGAVPNIALDPTVPPFITAAFTPGLTAIPPVGVVGLPTFNRVSWGTSTGAGQSYLDVAHIMNGLTTVTTNGAWETIDRFSHQNNVLTQAGGFMNFVAIFAEASLLPNLANGFGGLGVPGLSPISFLETFNAAAEALCSPTPNPTGSPLPCDDVFSTTVLEPTFQFFTDAGGTPYFISFRFVNETAVVLPGGLGILAYTAEQALSSTITQLRVFTVPEPTMLGLFGFALVGVALSRRRKVAA